MIFIVKSLLLMNSVLTCRLCVESSSNILDRESAPKWYPTKTLRREYKPRRCKVSEDIMPTYQEVEDFCIRLEMFLELDRRADKTMSMSEGGSVIEVQEEIQGGNVVHENIQNNEVLHEENQRDDLLITKETNKRFQLIKETNKRSQLIKETNKRSYSIKESTSDESRHLTQLRDNQESLKELDEKLGNLKQKAIQKKEEIMNRITETPKSERTSFLNEKKVAF